jgi:hypothetical protein
MVNVAEKACSKVKTIEDVTNLWDYDDENGKGSGDAEQVSCGQDKKSSGYSELQDKFDKYFDGIAKEKWISKLMCQCCKKLKPTGKEKVSWLKFYKCLESKVDSDTPKTLKKIQELIKKHTSKSK